MQCPQCQHENRKGRRFCAECGSQLDLACSACVFLNEPGEKFCGGCGTSLTASTPVQSAQQGEWSETRFQALLPAVIGLLQGQKRVTYRTLTYIFGLNDALLDEIREELTFKQLARDEYSKGLVWSGETQPITPSVVDVPSQPSITDTTAVTSSAVPTPSPVTEPSMPCNGPTRPADAISTDVSQAESTIRAEPTRTALEAERRQLTVMFCDLVGSTDLSGTLDPEDLRDVVRAYQEVAAEVIQRYEGHIAQYLGDGLLIYFGFPTAHEDDAQRAIYTGLGIPEAMAALNARLETDYAVQLAVRIGIHTGPVVVGEMGGGGGRHENLALGETPNIAARLEGLAKPNTTVMSPVTAQLVQRSFVLEELGTHTLKGVAEPMMLYTVVSPREVDHDDHEAMLGGGFDALVGRDEEIGLLLRRWKQSKEGQGQVVLISGEAGIGKSSLVEGLRQHVRQEGTTRITFRCSEYVQQSAMYPVIEHVHRVLGWQREDDAETRLGKLEQVLEPSSLPLDETVPLIAALLSLPLPEDRYPALSLSPPQQRQQTQDVLVAWMLEEAERQPLLVVWEDLHWADPSTQELLGLFITQVPTVSMLHVLVFRPTFVPPWPTQSHLTPLTLHRLERPQVEGLITRLAGGKPLPAEVVQHIVAKTDGVPLYVEELTKMLMESAFLQEEAEQYTLTGPLAEAAIPATLQDSLMARLDRLPMVKEVAQLGAVLGREFAYEMLQSLAVVEEPTLQEGLSQLVDTELLYQRGRPPRAKYTFRHALIRDMAYQSLLRRTRQQVHEQVAQLMEAQFSEVVSAQPELVAHHYTEAGCASQAITYWQRAGHQAAQHSANLEAIQHLTKGLELLATLAETPERLQQELDMQLTLGPVLMMAKGAVAPEVEQAYGRARELCREMGETPELFPVLMGLCRYYSHRGTHQTARELGAQLLSLAQSQNDSVRLLSAHTMLGSSYYFTGEFPAAYTHLEQGLSAADAEAHDARRRGDFLAPQVQCLNYAGQTLWNLGYPDQALQRSQEACQRAQEMEHPASLGQALHYMGQLHRLRREAAAAYARAEELITLSTEHGFAHWVAFGRVTRGWALAMRGETEEGIDQIRQALSALRDMGLVLPIASMTPRLINACLEARQLDEGWRTLAEAKTLLAALGSHLGEAELYRLEGELWVAQADTSEALAEAETHYLQALDTARHQQGKSWELRAAMSLARLWQRQNTHQEAYDLLAPVYEWFTEGFDTADLIEAKQLLGELSAEVMPPTA